MGKRVNVKHACGIDVASATLVLVRLTDETVTTESLSTLALVAPIIVVKDTFGILVANVRGLITLKRWNHSENIGYFLILMMQQIQKF